ncbi:MAG: hypothetical protein AAFW87_08030 [Pseudomonadota bacterium]
MMAPTSIMIPYEKEDARDAPQPRTKPPPARNDINSWADQPHGKRLE